MMNNTVTCAPNGDGTTQITAYYGGKTLQWVVSSRLFTQYGYYDNAPITEDDISLFERLAATTSAIRKGLYLLSFSDMPKSALAKKLAAKGFDKEISSDACVYLEQAGYINEQRHALRVGRAAVKQLHGRLSVANKLYAKGFEKKYIKKAMSQIEEETDFSEILGKFIEKKGIKEYLENDCTPEYRRALGAVMRRGFTSGDVSEYKSKKRS